MNINPIHKNSLLLTKNLKEFIQLKFKEEIITIIIDLN